MRMASCLAYVPLPTPGGPRKTTTGRRAVAEEDGDAKLVQSLRQVVSSRIFWCSEDELQQQTVHVVLRAKFRCGEFARRVSTSSKGFFNTSLPGPVGRLSLLRCDSDIFSSTYDTLTRLYPLLSVGGYVCLRRLEDHPVAAGDPALPARVQHHHADLHLEAGLPFADADHRLHGLLAEGAVTG